MRERGRNHRATELYFGLQYCPISMSYGGKSVFGDLAETLRILSGRDKRLSRGFNLLKFEVSDLRLPFSIEVPACAIFSDGMTNPPSDFGAHS